MKQKMEIINQGGNEKKWRKKTGKKLIKKQNQIKT